MKIDTMDDGLMTDVYRMLDILYNGDKKYESRIPNIGLRSLISNPHNLYELHDEKGKVTGWRIEIVYTPFKKEDVSVRVQDNYLYVEIGKENKEKSQDMVYQGISHQSSSFKMRVSSVVDMDNITASANEGVLTINLPVKAVAPKEIRSISIL